MVESWLSLIRAPAFLSFQNTCKQFWHPFQLKCACRARETERREKLQCEKQAYCQSNYKSYTPEWSTSDWPQALRRRKWEREREREIMTNKNFNSWHQLETCSHLGNTMKHGLLLRWIYISALIYAQRSAYIDMHIATWIMRSLTYTVCFVPQC